MTESKCREAIGLENREQMAGSKSKRATDLDENADDPRMQR
jgi:hypothetical protein